MTMPLPSSVFAEQVITTVDQVQPGDVIYLGALIPFTVMWTGEGWGRTWILRGRIPADHPLHGEGSELTLELEAGHHLSVHRPNPDA